MHFISPVEVIRNNFYQIIRLPVGIIGYFPSGWFFSEILRKVTQQVTALADGFFIIVAHYITGTAELHMIVGTTDISIKDL